MLEDWLRLSEAVKIAKVRLGPRANKALLAAIKEGLIKNGGIMETGPAAIAYRNIHLNTADFMLWLDEEEMLR